MILVSLENVKKYSHVVARLPQRLKSTLFEIFSTLRVPFGHPLTMYDFPDSTDIFEIFEVGLANSHILVTNHLPASKSPIFDQWRPDWRSGGRQFANLAPYMNI